MPYDVTISVTADYASFTATDGAMNRPCKVKNTTTNIENLSVTAPVDFDTSVLPRNGRASIIIEAIDAGAKKTLSSYDIPGDIDAKGTIFFPKKLIALETDVENIKVDVAKIKKAIAPGGK